VWYPSILSREKSFHHRNETKTVSNTEKTTTDKDNLKFKYNTRLPIIEKRIKETKSGQNEV